jgi:hypothetical protein
MNAQLIDSLIETIRTLSPAEKNVLWQKLERMPSAENDLLQKIVQTLPTTTQQRYNDLRSKLHAETLNTEEHQELLNLTDTIERFDAERLQYLLTLAQLRQISLPELLKNLNISTPAVYA